MPLVDEIIPEVVDAILHAVDNLPPLPAPKTLREQSIEYAKEMHRLAHQRFAVQSTPAAVAQMTKPPEKSARDIERMCKAEAKRLRRRNRGSR